MGEKNSPVWIVKEKYLHFSKWKFTGPYFSTYLHTYEGILKYSSQFFGGVT